MAIDLGNDPGGTPPTTAEKLQIRSAIGVGTTDSPCFLGAGIGTTSPTEKLHVLGGKVLFGDPADTTGTAGNGDLTLRAYRAPQLHITANNTSSNFFGLNLESNSVVLAGILLNPASGEVKIGGFHNGGYFPTFYSSSAEVMRFNTAGLLGIGTTNPVAKTDIADTWNAPAITVTGASGTGTTATLTFATQATAIPVGSTIVVASINPSGYNGTFVVTASTVTSVSYLNATSAAWVSGGTIERVFTSVKLNVIDTASNAVSKLMDLQVGGVSKFNVDKGGQFSAGGGNFNTTSTRVASTLPIALGGNGYIGFGPFFNPDSTALDAILIRDAPGILAQRNLSTAQQFRLYNTTDAGLTNYSRAQFEFSGGLFYISTANAGTGPALGLGFWVAGGSKWTIPTTGHFLAGADNQFDIGASGANRPRTIYAGTSMSSPTFVSSGSLSAFGSNTQVAGTLHVGYTGSASASLYAPSNGVLLIGNVTANDFGRLQLGGTTSAFPAIKRNGTGIDIVLANDSGYAPLATGSLTSSSSISAAIGSYVMWGGGTSSRMSAPSNGVIQFTNAATTSFTRLELGEADMGIMRGAGTPENIVTAKVGSIYLRTDGGSGSSFYVKESGVSNTGWVAK